MVVFLIHMSYGTCHACEALHQTNCQLQENLPITSSHHYRDDQFFNLLLTVIGFICQNTSSYCVSDSTLHNSLTPWILRLSNFNFDLHHRWRSIWDWKVKVNPCHARPPYGRTYPLGPEILWVYPTNQKDFINFYYCFNNVLHKLK